MNHSRPVFVQQALRERHGFAPRTYDDIEPRPSKLDWRLRAYVGADAYLQTLRAKVESGGRLSNKENGKAGELLAFVDRRDRAEEFVLASDEHPTELICRLRSAIESGEELTRTDVSDLQALLKVRGRKL